MTSVETLVSHGVESLFQAVGELPPKPAPVWLLIDPALRDPFGAASPFAEIARSSLPLRGTAPESCPYLLALDLHEQASAVQATIEIAAREALGEFDDETHGRPRSVCAWLIPADAAADVACTAWRLSQWALVSPGPSSSESVLFRFWDPRIALELPERLDSAQCQAMLGACGLSQWWAIDGKGSLIQMTARACEPETLAQASSWHATRNQWQRVNLLGLRNQLATMVAKWELEELPSDERIEDLASIASAAGLGSLGDLAQFVRCALTLHPRFYEHPEVADLLALLRRDAAEPGTFSMTVQQWSSAFKQELRADLWQTSAERSA